MKCGSSSGETALFSGQHPFSGAILFL
jgi:hypothetical protein